MSSYPTRLLSPIIRNLILSINTLFVVGMSLVDVSLHHLVLLVNNCSGWQSNTLVTFLARFTDALKSRILSCYANITLERIHRLWSSHHVLSVSHLVLGWAELWSLYKMTLLLINLEASGVLEILWLGLGSAWHGGTGPISWNLSLRLVVKN